MKILRLEGTANRGFTTVGSMWEKGTVQKDSIFMVKTSDGDMKLQSRVTAYWPDGSVKWAAHVVKAEEIGDEAEIFPVLNQEAKDESEDNSLKDGNKEAEAISNISHGSDKIIVRDIDDESFEIRAGRLEVIGCKKGNTLFKNLFFDGKLRAEKATLRVLIENREDEYTKKVISYEGEIENAQVKECGDTRCVVKFRGIHRSSKDKKIPFSIFMEIYKDCPELKFTHTFFYDGEEKKDFLKGVGISFDVPAEGEQYNRHVKFVTDHGCFNEENAMLLCWHPRVDSEIYKAQVDGEKLDFSKHDEKNLNAIKASKEMPIWNDYYLFQDSSEHFVIKKKTNKKDVCYIDCLNGNRAKGIAAFGSERGGIMLGLKDFWQKYPSTIEFNDVSKDIAKATIWLLPPQADAYDFRHYEDTGYSQTYYEGFDVFGASAYGIANTSEYSLRLFDEIIPDDSELYEFYERVQNRAFYYAGAEYLHELKAFGFWSLEKRDTKAEKFLEEQLDKAFDFYKGEVEQRKWYGMFDYGDFMHTYDPYRHVWRYDMGGYAWQNTELVPTFWLWFYFLRTGRRDAFKICEAMTRHCSEVDVYHFGKYKGLGSRHNVRHWGCPCKEARIAMAGHHRMYYYMTGDYRLQDYFEEVKDGDIAVGVTDPLRFFFDKKEMVYPTHARTGPDWSSFCSNWMTWWEQSEDKTYLQKIKTGIADLKETPLKLMSGTDFEYDPATSHMRYIGDRATGGSHLSICQGSEQTWLEMTLLMDDPEWNKMLADYGWFYTLDNAEQNRITQGRIGERQFSYPFMAAGVVAYAAYYYDDEKLGKKVWDILYSALETEFGQILFDAKDVQDAGNQEVLKEIPGISTNSTAQWCLNVIVALEFAAKWLPESF